MPRQKTLSTIPAAHSSDGIKTKGHKVTNEVQKIELRIAELEEAKAALLQHAERLEQARDESSTYAVLLNKDSDGLRAFEDLSDELIKVAGKVAAFDKALAAEQANLAEASRFSTSKPTAKSHFKVVNIGPIKLLR